MKAIELPSVERLNELFYYDEETGKLFNKVGRGNKAKKNQESGCVNKVGYKQVNIEYKLYLVHRVIWKLNYGSISINKQIDHIDRNRLNNRLVNLRLVNNKENSKNQKIRSDNSSSIMGVGWHKIANKWRARIVINGKEIHLGLFTALSLAKFARFKAEKKYNFHKNHGRK